MEDESRMKHIEWWANWVREHPKEWRKHTTPFIDAQIAMANGFYKRLEKMSGGKEKIIELRKLKDSRRN